MRPTYVFFIGFMYLLAAANTNAQNKMQHDVIKQDQMPIVELQHYLPGKVWILEKECLGENCYTRTDSTYYFTNGDFEGYKVGGTTLWGFTFHNAFYFKPFENSQRQLEIASCTQRICVIGVNAESSVYTVHYTGETGTYQMEINTDGENSFVLQGPSWGHARTTRKYRAVTPPQDVADFIAKVENN